MTSEHTRFYDQSGSRRRMRPRFVLAHLPCWFGLHDWKVVSVGRERRRSLFFSLRSRDGFYTLAQCRRCNIFRNV